MKGFLSHLRRQVFQKIGGDVVGDAFKTGTYTGNGAATQAITGVGFNPKFVIIYPRVDNLQQGHYFKSDGDGTKTMFDNEFGAAYRYLDDMIISLDADGFTVGDGTGFGNQLNVSGRVYTYVCWG